MITNRTILCQKNIDIREGFFPKDLKPEDVLFFDIETTGRIGADFAKEGGDGHSKPPH